MGTVRLARNLGTNDARILDVEPSEAREGKQIDVEGDVRDELVLAGLAHEGDDLGSGGLDLSDPEIRKKLEDREVELNLAAGLLQLQQERQREEFERTTEAEGELKAERDRLRDEKRKKGEQLMDERRNEPPKGPDEQPQELFGGVRIMGTKASKGDVDVESEEEQDEKRRREQERRGQPQPGQPQPGPSQPRPGQPGPTQPGGPQPTGPGRTGGGQGKK